MKVFRRKPNINQLLSICPGDGGIAMARIMQEGGAQPSLELCAFETSSAGENSDAVLSKLVKSHSLDRYQCTSTMDLGTYNLLLVEAPDVPPAELRAAMRWRVKDLLDFHIDDAVIDVFEVGEDEHQGRNRMMYAVAARSSMVKQRVDALLDAGLSLRYIDIPELAMRNLSSLLPEDASGVALVYLVGGGGLIIISRRGRLYLSRLVDMSRDAHVVANVSDSRSAEAKVWLERIVIELQRSMDYYESHFSQPPITHLVVAPMDHEVSGIERYLSEQLGIATRLLDLNTVLDCEEPLTHELQHRCLFAIGAALRVEGKTL